MKVNELECSYKQVCINNGNRWCNGCTRNRGRVWSSKDNFGYKEGVKDGIK